MILWLDRTGQRGRHDSRHSFAGDDQNDRMRMEDDIGDDIGGNCDAIDLMEIIKGGKLQSLIDVQEFSATFF